MRFFEVLTLGALFLALVVHFWPVEKRLSWFYYVPSVAVLLVLIHLIVERYRWQMVPAYAFALLLFLLGLRRMRRQVTSSVSRRKYILRTMGASLWLALAIALPALFPVFKLPEPSGPYMVGSTSFRMVDMSREETLTPDPDDKRELAVQVWYPADELPDGAHTAAYWGDPGIFCAELSRAISMLTFLFDHLAYVKTHTYAEAPLATDESTYPVLIFSHGYFAGFAAQNTSQMEELASHGYIIFSIAHPYEGLAAVYPDGEVVLLNYERERAMVNEQAALLPLHDQIESTVTDEAERRALDAELKRKKLIANESLAIWADDTMFVIDELERLDREDSRFAGKLDLSRIGVFGMSFGGATAAQVCLLDDRCQAGINFDGGQVGEAYLEEDVLLDRPFMMMYSEMNEGANDDMLESVNDVAYRVTVTGATHYDYCDMTFISPLFQVIGFTGPIGGQRMSTITSAYTLAFFDRHLGGKPAPLLDGVSSDYQEVAVEVWTP